MNTAGISSKIILIRAQKKSEQIAHSFFSLFKGHDRNARFTLAIYAETERFDLLAVF